MENVENSAASTTATAPVETTDSTPEYKELSELSPPEYTKWRETGEVPKKSAPPKTEDSAASKESAGDGEKPSEAAPDPAPGKQEPKGKVKNAETRKAELAAEVETELKKRADLRRENAELESRNKALKEGKTEAAESSTAKVEPTRPKPTPEDVDPKTKQPKYATYEDFVEDLADWRAEQRFAARDAEQEAAKAKETKAQREAEASKQRQQQEKAINAAHAEGKKLFKDYEQAVFGEKSPIARIPEQSPMDEYLMAVTERDGALAARMLHHLATHGEEVDRIAALDDHSQREAMVELKLTLKQAPEKKPIAAFSATADVGAKGSAAGDPLTKAVKDGDFTAYKALMDAEERKQK